MKYPLAFENFWGEYPRRVGKKAAFKAWTSAVSDVEPEVLINAVRKQLEAGQFQDLKYTPHPSTWINGERWEDEIVQNHNSNDFGEGTNNILRFRRTGS